MRTAVLVASAFCVVGCATITKGTSQTILVNTPGVVQATCVINTPAGIQTVLTPGTLVVQKTSSNLPVRCTKECYQDGVGVLGSGIEAMAAGNVVLGGVIGLGIDAATGAMNKYPDEISIAMAPDPSCRPPATARR